jgi:DNA primase
LRYTQDIIFCFDGDRAGQQAAWKALTINLPILRDDIQIRFLFLPEKEDPDSLVRTIGKDVFEKKLQEAKPLSAVFFESLEQQFPLKSLDAKVRFAHEAMQLINTMPNGIFRQLMSQQLTDRCHLSMDEINRLGSSTQAASETTLSRKTRILSPAQFASALLLHYPHLAQKIDDASANNANQKSLLIRLIAHFRQHPEITTGELLTQWDNPEERQTIAKLAAYQLPIPETGVEAEFLGAIARLKERRTKQQLQQLINKAKSVELNLEEKQQLQSLLRNKVDQL